LWNPYVLSKCAGTLVGHNTAITSVVVSPQEGYIISVSEDKVIKIWDTRTLSCVQTIFDKVHTRPENSITSLFYDWKNKCLLTGTITLDVWPLAKLGRSGSNNPKSHDAPIVKAVFNTSFKQIVSGCTNSNIKIWNMASGEKTFQIQGVHNELEITAMTFDSSQRRLITASRDGMIKIWNFNNGALLQILTKDNNMEVTDLIHVEIGQNKYVLAVGWDRKISVFLDNPSTPQPHPIRIIKVDSTVSQRG
jgi:WD40 repeat protein